MDRLAGWLRGRQNPDGSWPDRWHVSPYYATVCCALALDEFGGPAARDSVRRAVRWVLSTQRADGSWGLWRGTAEETAYAMQSLLLTQTTHDEPAHGKIITQGYAYLLRSAGRSDDPPMWIDKDLYFPGAIVRAAILGAMHLAQRQGR